MNFKSKKYVMLVCLLSTYVVKAQTNYLEKNIDDLLKNNQAAFCLNNKALVCDSKSYKLKQLSEVKLNTQEVPGMKAHKFHYPASAHILYTDEYAKQQFTFKADTPIVPAIKPIQHFYLNTSVWQKDYFLVSYNNALNNVVSITYRGEDNQTIQYDFDAETGDINNYTCKVNINLSGEISTDNKQYIFAILDLTGKENSDEMRCLKRGKQLQQVVKALWNMNANCKNTPFIINVNESAIISGVDSLMKFIESSPGIITVAHEPVWDYFKANLIQVKCTIEKQNDYCFRYSHFEGYKTTRGRITNTLLNRDFEELILKNLSTNNPTNHCLELFVTLEVILVIDGGKCVAVVW